MRDLQGLRPGRRGGARGGRGSSASGMGLEGRCPRTSGEGRDAAEEGGSGIHMLSCWGAVVLTRVRENCPTCHT